VRTIRYVAVAAACAIVAGGAVGSASAASHAHGAAKIGRATMPAAHWCNTNGVTCTEPYQNWEDFSAYSALRRQGVNLQEYIGHDEPLMEFYSNRPGSGNDTTYVVTLPKDPPVKPQQDGSGGTWNFQLRPAFWMGMNVCDDQSAPNPHYAGAPYPTNRCKPDSDQNIFTSQRASSPRYIGKAPGGAFLELQFYPPGWVKWPVGNSCDATRWCSALNIDSFNQNENTGQFNNNDCLNTVGPEPVNFAFLTKNGHSTEPANPLEATGTISPSRDFFMRGGDTLRIHIFDTSAGLRTEVDDLTTHTRGLMTASVANGFGAVRFAPSASTCTVIPQAFHPMYSTAKPAGRLFWTAHTGNISLSDEIGHFEWCNKVDVNSPVLGCKVGGGFDTNNVDPEDDNYCLPFPGIPSTASTRIHVTGCLGVFGDSDLDFDGVSYNDLAWPGSIANRTVTRLMVPTPLTFTSPTSRGGNFSRAAFETDLPRIEDFRPDDPFGGVSVNCERFARNPSDPSPGAHCVNPPPQSRDYPFFVTARGKSGSCVWKEVGGTHLAGIRNAFGGSPRSEFGPLLATPNPTNPAGSITVRLNNFHRTLSGNPCLA
jgi:hypothetical protein